MVNGMRPIRLRKILLSAVLLGGVLSGGTQAAFAGKPHPARSHEYKREIEAIEAKWRVAQLNNDADAMDKLLSDDYVGISMTGQVNTKAQQLERMRKRKLVLTRIDQGEMKVKLLGQVAIVTSTLSVAGTNDDIPFQGAFRYMRVYHRTPGEGWKITSFEVTRMAGGDENKPNPETKTQ